MPINVTIVLNKAIFSYFDSMRAIPVILFFCSGSTFLFGQGLKEQQHFYYDANWQPVIEKKAVYHVRVRNINDTTWRRDTYNYFGPIIRTATYKDEQATIPNGEYVSYRSTGRFDSICNFSGGQPHGEWLLYGDTAVKEQRTYEWGKLVIKRDGETYQAWLKERRKPYEGKQGIESEFPGGDSAWKRYLNRHLVYPQKAISKEVSGKVRLRFIVDTSGYVTNVQLVRSVAMPLDDQLRDRVNNSVRWKPATIEGKPVKSYKIQEIFFGLEEEGKHRK